MCMHTHTNYLERIDSKNIVLSVHVCVYRGSTHLVSSKSKLTLRGKKIKVTRDLGQIYFCW